MTEPGRARGLWRLLAVGWTLAVFAACALPGAALRDVAILTADKLLHAVSFFVFAVLWRGSGTGVWRVAAGGVAFAVWIEWWQATVAVGRFADPFDALADVLGLALGLWAFRAVFRARDARARRQRPPG